jgi:hypothetical protein
LKPRVRFVADRAAVNCETSAVSVFDKVDSPSLTINHASCAVAMHSSRKEAV